MAIITRADKGSALTHNEVDANFTDLRDGVDARTPAAAAETGIKVGGFGADDYGWHDLRGHLDTDYLDADAAPHSVFIGGLKAHQFTANVHDAYVTFHIPHDYKIGTNLFFHVHWAHNSATITGGTVTWAIEVSYARGHNQGANSVFSTPKIITVAQAAGLNLEHMIAETAGSVSGGSANQLDTDIIEPDGLVVCRLYLDSNDLTDSVSVPNPFAFEVDIHYQSTNVATKNKEPNFYG